MMSNPNRMVGFNRKVDLLWLDTVAGWAAAGVAEDELAQHFAALLESIDQGKETRRKIKDILSNIWLQRTGALPGFHETGLTLYRTLPPAQRLPLHWGRCIVAYPFFAFVATQIGRLYRLQGDVTAGEVRRRIIEQYGESEWVKRSLRYVIQSLHNWQVLDSKASGTYVICPPCAITDPTLMAWLAEAYLRATHVEAVTASSILSSPLLFPFAFADLSAQQLSRHNPRLEALQQGLNQDVLMLQATVLPRNGVASHLP